MGVEPNVENQLSINFMKNELTNDWAVALNSAGAGY